MAASAEEITRREQSPALLQARQAVESFFQQLRGPLQAERERLEQKSELLAQRQEQFRKDRSELESWFAEQEQRLLTRSQDASTDDANRVAELEEQIERLRGEMTDARRDAERKIRNLADKLAENTSRQFRSAPVQQDGENKSAA